MTLATRRLIDTMLALTLLGTLMLAAGITDRWFWQATSPSSLDRFARDRIFAEVAQPRPLPLPQENLWLLCDGRPWHSYVWNSHDALAACVEQASAGPHLAQLEHLTLAASRAQLAFANQANAALRLRAKPILESLRRRHQLTRDNSGGPVLRWLESHGVRPPASPYMAPIAAVDAASIQAVEANGFRAAAAERSLAALDDLRTRAPGDQAGRVKLIRSIALATAGYAIDVESAVKVPKPHLVRAADSLAAQIEVAARSAVLAGAPLDYFLQRYLTMMTIGGVIAIILSGALGAYPSRIATLIGIATLSGLHLADIAYSGSPLLRNLPARDYGEGVWTGWGTGIWGGAIALLIGLALGCALSSNRAQWPQRILLCPQWVLATASTLPVLIALSALPGMAGVKSELMLAAVALPMAVLLARYASVLQIGKPRDVMLYATPLIASALTIAIAAHWYRSDLGGLIVASVVTLAALLWIAKSRLIQIVLLVILILLLVYYGNFIANGKDSLELLTHFPTYARERFTTILNSGLHGAPDVNVATNLMKTTSLWGWLPGQTPWLGFPGAAPSAALPVPVVSDLPFVVPTAIYGLVYSTTLCTVLAAIMAGLAIKGFTIAVTDKGTVGKRFAGGLGALGLAAALLRLTWSLFSALQVLPESGLPITLVSHAPAAAAAFLFYAGLAAAAARR